MPLPDPKPTVFSDKECAICHEPLHLPNDTDPHNPSYVIDDVQLRCKHHFHKSCIIEYAASSTNARQQCALCRENILDRHGDFMVTIRTENNSVGSIDLGRDIDQEMHLNANPEIGRAQLFLSLMSQMEYGEAEKMLKGEIASGDGSGVDPNVTYETGGQTAMHMAALNNDVEGVRLLLRYGADKNCRDEDGMTVRDAAGLVDAKDVMALLR